MVKKDVHYKFSQEMDDCLKELSVWTRGPENKTAWLEYVLSDFVRQSLKGRLHRAQVAMCKTPDELFWLFVTYRRAERKEAGYKFTHKDPDKRFVSAPG